MESVMLDYKSPSRSFELPFLKTFSEMIGRHFKERRDHNFNQLQEIKIAK
tara:strand:+ start:1594 stop:1743 length:150 start_codon:yes stop_codon:yes gene_type:complete